jgi:hypothetical protein
MHYKPPEGKRPARAPGGPQHFCKAEKTQIAHFISLEGEIKKDMFAEYIQAALEKAQYKVMGDRPHRRRCAQEFYRGSRGLDSSTSALESGPAPN